MSRVHFVYFVPPARKKIYNYYNELALRSKLFQPIYRNHHDKIDWPDPVFAPSSITFHVLNAIKNKRQVKLYDLREEGICQLDNNDILLAHLSRGKQQKYQSPFQTVGGKSIKRYETNNKFIIGPYNHDCKQIGWLKEVFANTDIKFITICGEYWSKNWNESPLKEVLPKENVFQVNMAIDTNLYPLVKKKFSKKNKRKFLYVGRTSYPKNIEQLEAIAKSYKGFKGGYISGGEIKGWEKIASFASLTSDYLSFLAKEYDFFLSTSIADAQATTILEFMSAGLGVACTPESGVSYPSVFSLDKNDTSYNCQQISKMQNIEEEELVRMSIANHKIIKEEHNWENFCHKVLKVLNI